MIKLVERINAQEILNEYLMLEKDISWTHYGKENRQAGLQFKDNDNPWTSSVGKSKGEELLYNNLNPFFQGTIFEKLIKRFDLKRTRLMWVGPNSCYSMHADTTPRIHIPLVTNDQCFFVFNHQKPFHIPIDTAMYVDTRLLHTFMNCSDQHRLHLVGIVSPLSLTS